MRYIPCLLVLMFSAMSTADVKFSHGLSENLSVDDCLWQTHWLLKSQVDQSNSSSIVGELPLSLFVDTQNRVADSFKQPIANELGSSGAAPKLRGGR